jgi:hypothetical protein
MKIRTYVAVICAAAGMWAIGPLPATAKPLDKRSPQIAAGNEEDEYQGLPPGKGRDEVFGICGACHSLKLVTQQGLSRDRWDYVLHYMVEEQEMPELDKEMTGLILDYLTKFSGPNRKARSMQK